MRLLYYVLAGVEAAETDREQENLRVRARRVLS